MRVVTEFPSAAADAEVHAPRVLLAGSFVSFSDSIVAVLRREFPSFDVQRVAPAALSGADPAGAHLVVLEEALASAAPGLLAQGAHVALAFDDAEALAARLDALDGAPPDLSLLPMNVRLDVWLSILRLILCGETYVPAGLRPARARAVPAHQAFAGDGGAMEGRATEDRAADGWAPDGGAGGGRAAPSPRALTDRERLVLPLIAQGRQNKVIASELNISEHTVKLHVHHIIGKLGVRNRTEAARLYLSRRFMPEAG